MTSLYAVPRIVTSGKPIRMRNVVQHRTDNLIQEQISVVRASQEVFRRSLQQLDSLSPDNGRLVERMADLVEDQRSELNEMILIAQIAAKIKRELVHARGELKKALKTSTNIYGARKRLVWLEGQLEHLLTEKCPKALKPIDIELILTPTPTPTPPPIPKDLTPEPCPTPESDNRSENEKVADDMRDALSRMESNMMSKEELQDTWSKYKERRDAPRVEVDYDALLDDLLDDEDPEEGEDEETVLQLASLGIDVAELARPSRQSDMDFDEEEQVDIVVGEEVSVDTAGGKESLNVDLEENAAPTENSQESHSREDTEVETEEAKESEADDEEKSVEDEAESESGANVEEPEAEMERLKTSESLKDGPIVGLESGELSPDLGREYWHSEHHRFHFSAHAQTLVELDPLSYHQVGLAVPGTFIKTTCKSTPTLPWRPRQPGEIHDVHRVALDKLELRVQKMYDHIYDAAMLSVDPNHNHVQDRAGHFLQNVAKPADVRSSHSGSGESAHDAPVLPPIKSRSGPLVAMKFHSKPIPHAKRLPVSKLNLHQSYPRSATELAIEERSKREKPRRIVDQRDLHQETKLTSSLFHSKVRRTSTEPVFELAIHSAPEAPERNESRLRKAMSVARVASRLGTALPQHGRPPGDGDGLKWRRVNELVTVNFKSARPSDRAEAAKQLGLMGCTDVTVVTRLEEGLLHDSDQSVKYESAKALMSLGEVSDDVLSLLVECLVTASTAIRLDILRAIIDGRNVHLIDRNLANFKSLVKVLNKFLLDPDPGSRLAFDAAVCLGNLCVPSENATARLKSVLAQEKDSNLKAEALSTLVRQMNCRDQLVQEAIFNQMKTSHVWRHRADAARLLIVLGPDVVCKEAKPRPAPKFLTVSRARTPPGESRQTSRFDHVYSSVEERLWDEPSYEVRKVVAAVAQSLGMVARACERAEKKLEDTNEKVRAQAVTTIGTLGLKKKGVVKTLLEMVELDSSEYVRLQVIKTFGLLSLREKKVLRCLRERAKAGGSLGREAIKVLTQFGEPLQSG